MKRELRLCHVVMMICYVVQWDGEDSIWGTRPTPIRSQGGVGEQMGRNGVAREMPLLIKSIANGI